MGRNFLNRPLGFLPAQLTDMATAPVKYEPIHKPLEESTVSKILRKTKKSDAHLERSTSFRLGTAVIRAADIMAREDSRTTGKKVSRADIIRESVMERYRRQKEKQNE